MKLLHLLGHNHNWALDAFFKNQIGDGFIICAYSVEKEKLGQKLSGYKSDQYLPCSFLDLEFYGSKASNGKKLKTYEFHPMNYSGDDATEISTLDAIVAGVGFQESLGLNGVIIPNIQIPLHDSSASLELISGVSSKIRSSKKPSVPYFMTVPISGALIREDKEIESLLQKLTDIDICFDGYYIVCEPNLETRKKVSVDFKYYTNLIKIISVLKKNGFKIILGFANIDALLFSAFQDIDFVTIGTYENLRNFSFKRFTEKGNGGPSDGWYYSEKLLNFIKAKQLEIIHERGAIDLISNQDNIFSDIILQRGYPWNTHRPDVHKNYLLAISRQLKEVAQEKTKAERIAKIESMIETARSNYKKLEEKGVYLDDESSNYHLALWQSILKTPDTGVVLKN